MHSKLLVSVLTASAIFTPVPAAGQDDGPRTFAPSSQWHLDMAEHKCRIARTFGEEAKPTVFYLEQFNPWSSADWAVAGDAVAEFSQSREIRFRFAPGGDEGEIEPRHRELGGFGQLIGGFSSIVDKPDPEEGPVDAKADELDKPRGLPSLDGAGAAGIDRLELGQRGKDTIILDLGSMNAPLEALNICMRDLVEYWGFDPEEQAKVVSGPELSNLLKVAQMIQRSYPARALRNQSQADFHMRTTIGADGTVEDCELINITLADDFDMTVSPCTLFKKYADVEPARLTDGTPIRSYAITRIMYVVR